MILINFGHPISEDQRAAIESLAGSPVSRLIDVETHFDSASSFDAQARQLVDSVGLTAVEWQTETLLVSLPTLHVGAAIVLADLHGRIGYFPSVVRLKPVQGSATSRFELAEILNLQSARDIARSCRSVTAVSQDIICPGETQ